MSETGIIQKALSGFYYVRCGDETVTCRGRGRHTTRHVELFPVAGGLIADTPGFSAFDAEEVGPKEDLAYAFREFRPYLDRCRYVGCAHVKEAGCAVLEAVAEGKIPASRHRSYVRLYELAREVKPWEKKP